MKWGCSSVALSLCAFLAVASSSPSGKKDFEGEISGKKINPAAVPEPEEGDDDLLSRAKKSSTTTTFCVEIKPGNEQPAVVVCDPAKADHQVPIPSQTPPPPPAPTQHYDPSNYLTPQAIPGLDANYPRGLEPQPSPSPYESLIFIPQQPQAFPSYVQPTSILQPFSAPQPQIILVRDPSCPSSSPSIAPIPWQPSLSAGRLYTSNPYGKSSQYGTEAGDLWKSGYDLDADAQRSLSMSNFGGLFPNGYSSPLDLIYSRRGEPQQGPLTNTVTLGQGGLAPVNGNQNFEGQYNRPFVVQCNPKVVPLPQDAYASVIAGKANGQGFKTIGLAGGANGYPNQFTYQSSGLGPGGVHTAHETMHHHQKGLPTHAAHHHQSNAYPYNMQYKEMMPGYGGQGRVSEESQSGQEMPMQQDQPAGGTEQSSQSSFGGGGNHRGVSSSGGAGGALANQEQQKKMGSEKLMGGGENSGSGFHPASIGKGQNSFVNGDRLQTTSGKDQGFPKQMGFSHNQIQQQQQHQEQTMPVASHAGGMGQKHSQQTGGNDMSYSQMLMNRMKSAVGQGNLVQPFMASSPGLAGEKQSQSKV